VVVIAVVIWFAHLNNTGQDQPTAQNPLTPVPNTPTTEAYSSKHQPPSVEKNNSPNSIANKQQPSTPPPKFRVYRSKIDEGTSIVVAPNTTDDQLRSLLWFFRENVRSHHFKEVGILQPTSRQWGKNGYLSGIISVYRGEKCANEGFNDYKGSCDDDNEAATYQWGLLVDGAFNTDADAASIYDSNRNLIEVFDYKDHWQLPPAVQAGLDAERKTDQDKEKLRAETRKLVAEELDEKLRASGFDINVRARDESGEELALDSEMFKDTATRVEFLSRVLPKWRRDLCTAGFRQVRLMRGGFFSTGNAYSLGCK